MEVAFIVFIYVVLFELQLYVIGKQYYEAVEHHFEFLWNNHYYLETIKHTKSSKMILMLMLNIMYVLDIGKLRSKINKLLKDAKERRDFAIELGINNNDRSIND